MESKKNKNKKVLKVLGLIGLFVLVFGLSYALFRITLTGRKKTRIKTANFGLTLTDINGNEETEGIAVNLDNALPETDEEGLARNGYKFVVTNTGNIPASYELKLNSTGDLSTEYIKYALIEKDYLKKANGDYYMGGIYSNAYRWEQSDWDFVVLPPLKLNSLNNNKLGGTTLLPGEKMEYELKLWIDEDAGIEASNKIYEASIVIDGSQAKEYMSGKTGDTSKYTLYDDGTLAITGSGELKTIYMNNNVIYFDNNIGPFGDIALKYLNQKGYDLREAKNVSVDLATVGPNEMPDEAYYLFVNTNIAIKNSNIFTLKTMAERDSTEDTYEMMAMAGVEYNTANQMFQELLNMPMHVTRVVIDEGITSLKNGYSSTGFYANYMKTLPSTLEDLNVDENLSNIVAEDELNNYCGYGLIIPPAVEKITPDLNISSKIQYLGINSPTVDHFSISGNLKEVYISNTVTTVNNKGFSISRDVTINIDNTREFVEENWDPNWYTIKEDNVNVTVNYLR